MESEMVEIAENGKLKMENLNRITTKLSIIHFQLSVDL